jgi:hypothetical protein
MWSISWSARFEWLVCAKFRNYVEEFFLKKRCSAGTAWVWAEMRGRDNERFNRTSPSACNALTHWIQEITVKKTVWLWRSSIVQLQNRITRIIWKYQRFVWYVLVTRRWTHLRNTNTRVPDIVSVLSTADSAFCLDPGTERDRESSRWKGTKKLGIRNDINCGRRN